MCVMFFLLIFLSVTNWTLASESAQDTSANNPGGKHMKTSKGALGFYASLSSNPISMNKTYFEKDENPLRVPQKFYEERKKKKKIKKSPKRTIQKIIKNNRNKSRKIYVHPVTRLPTVPPERVEFRDSNTQRNENIPTEKSHRKKARKSSKVVRYPMPFHQFQYKKDMNGRKRTRRDVQRDDVNILNDLDEIEFLSKEEDYDIVKAHIQHHW